MDPFVRSTLNGWGLEEHVQTFEDRGIDKRRFEALSDEEIETLFPEEGPRARFMEKYRSFKVQPTTSNTGRGGSGKRKSNYSSEHQQPAKLRCETEPDTDSEHILGKVKEIMEKVQDRLEEQRSTRVIDFLKSQISELEMDKKELVGVFGKTGAGKSSLINAIIGQKDLLPISSTDACTSVMIQVEANMDSRKYEAEVEFITQEEWKDDLWFMYNFVKEDCDEENDEEENNEEEYDDFVKKMSALYGEEWKCKSPDKLMKDKHFNKEIPEFFQPNKKRTFKCDTASELSKKLVKYTRSDDNTERDERRYWPLVKCVTIKVPQKPILQHITLMDLPGTGDCNKSRDQMWKEHVGNCSTVWIVTESIRAAAEKEAWGILKSVSRLIGNGGECQQIHFICTKSDELKDEPNQSRAAKRAKVKESIKRHFNTLNKIKKHISDDSFKVFTVCSEEFQNPNCPNPDETEIPELQKILKNLYDNQSRALNYVSGAYGILSLIQGAKNTKGSRTDDVCKDLRENLRKGLNEVRSIMEGNYSTFEKCLSDGVENSKRLYEKDLNSFLKPTKDGRGFHKILKCVVKNSGIYQPRKTKEMNLNVTLAQHLTDSIDDEFMKTFPNKTNSGPFNGAINKFSLDTKKLIQKYKDTELLLIFLEMEETKIKMKLINTIRDHKKTLYKSLADTIKENMEDGYKKAKLCKGKGMLEKTRDVLKTHVAVSQDVMFNTAKETMLNKLKMLQDNILKELEQTLDESILLSLKTNHDLIPDFPEELDTVRRYYDRLKALPQELS